MFSSVRRCTGDLTCEVLILTCFGNLPPDRQVYLGMGTMIVKETIRGEGKRIGVSAMGVSAWKEGGDVSACRRWGVSAWEEGGDVSAWGRMRAAPGISTPPAPIRPYADTFPRSPGIFRW
jgi:hypothetical protein